MKKLFTYTTLMILFTLSVSAQQNSQAGEQNQSNNTDNLNSETNMFLREASYTGDFAGNFSGGNKRGSTYLGMAIIKLGFDTRSLGLWDGGQFFVNGVSTHGGTPSGELIGDFQVASNIEAGNHTYLQELWFKQSIGVSEIIIGLQDLNSEFVVSEVAGDFLNSSFGIPSLIADNTPVPLFPLTALGIIGKFQISDDVIFQAAAFDGSPEVFDNNQYNINWNLNADNGMLFFSEIQFSTEFMNLPGIVKAGGYYHTHLKEFNEESNVCETVFNKNFGLYMLTDQTIWQKNGNKSLGLFVQLAFSPGNINTHNYYAGGGLNYRGVFDEDGNDALGIAFANAGFNNCVVSNETTIELFYKTQITENLFIQPDIQYIFNPAGTEEKLDNALAAFLRFGINF